MGEVPEESVSSEHVVCERNRIWSLHAVALFIVFTHQKPLYQNGWQMTVKQMRWDFCIQFLHIKQCGVDLQ